MPQLIGGVIIVIVVIYAFIYLLTIAIYAALFGLAAAAAMWVVAMISAMVLDGASQGHSQFAVDTAADKPCIVKSTQKSETSTVSAASVAIGAVVGGCVLYAVGSGIQESGGSDPAWIRQTGVWAASLVLAASSLTMYRWLDAKRAEVQKEHLHGLSPLLERYVAHLESATRASGQVGAKIESSGWTFLELAFHSSSEAGTESEISKLLETQIECLCAAERDFRQMSNDLAETQDLLRQASIHAAQIGSRSLLALADSAALQLDSPDFNRRIHARDISGFQRSIHEIKSTLLSVLECRAEEKQAEHAKQTSQGSDFDDSVNLTSVEDALAFLGLPSDASEPVINSRLKKLSGYFHPDRASDLVETERRKNEEKMKCINRARDILREAGRL